MADRENLHVDLHDDEFERLGQRAGAELRLQPPENGPGTIVRTVRRRRTTFAAMAAGVTCAVVVAGLFVANSRPHDSPGPVATAPPTLAPVVVGSVPSESKDATPPDALGTTTPGTWRAVSDSSSLAPDFPAAAVWTGTEAIVIGSNVINNSEPPAPPSASAYDVGKDRWRSLADPPPPLTHESLRTGPSMQWTGSEVLVATRQGVVYSYDPVRDQWDARARADESMSLPAENALVAVAATGVLARSSAGWWWYENTTNRWESVPGPSGSGIDFVALNTLDQRSIVATQIDGATITSAVFDTAASSWRNGPAVDEAPVSSRPDQPPTCDANGGLLVCSAEGYASLDGVVIDPLVGALHTFGLGSHSNTLTTRGLPWMTHAWKLFSPRSATWEDLPPNPYSDVDSFAAAVWTGSEIIFFGDTQTATSEPLGATAAYTPFQLPGD